MQVVEYEGISVDRCTSCKGLWFDMLEHEHLKEIEGSESIDLGSSHAGKKKHGGKKKTERDPIDCPVCKTRLIRMVDRSQPHIWYEACTSCYGVFFDAGEFRDYKERTVLVSSVTFSPKSDPEKVA
jgi:Zn-finger nucleic acid-binding protein